MTFQMKSFLSLGPHEFHRIAYTQWGKAHNDKVLMCVHGMTRNSRDFDYFARAMEADYKVICPDLVGRGRSEWLNVKQDYDYPLYCSDMAALLARLYTDQVDWVGTSMGGMIGMLLAAVPNSPIRRLVLNDVGPFMSKAALERIAEYVGADPRFRSLDEVEAYLREINAPFGPLTDEQWAHYAQHGSRQTEDGDLGLAYDPAIGLALRSGALEEVSMWPVWDAVRCPVLILRGAESDVLLPETAEEMLAKKPQAKLVEFTGIGHVPALMAKDQIDIVREWLLAEG